MQSSILSDRPNMAKHGQLGVSEAGADVSRAAVYRHATGRAVYSRSILGEHWQPKPQRGKLKIDGIPTSE
jgi:hypothetical protein